LESLKPQTLIKNGLVNKDWGDYYFSAKQALRLESLKPQE